MQFTILFLCSNIYHKINYSTILFEFFQFAYQVFLLLEKKKKKRSLNFVPIKTKESLILTAHTFAHFKVAPSFAVPEQPSFRVLLFKMLMTSSSQEMTVSGQVCQSALYLYRYSIKHYTFTWQIQTISISQSRDFSVICVCTFHGPREYYERDLRIFIQMQI